MTSHRSGETEDNYIADLAVGLCTGQVHIWITGNLTTSHLVFEIRDFECLVNIIVTGIHNVFIKGIS
jgi:uncharacterized membrane protein